MPLFLTAVFILSGAAGLIYESIWSRYLGLLVGHSAYAQVIVLVIFLGGMSAGAGIAARRSERIREPLFWYAAVEVVVGLFGLFFHELFEAASAFAYASVFPALAGGAPLLTVKWSIAGLLILPQSVLLGMTFPLMSAGFLRSVSPDSATDSGRVLALLYFANSIGAAAGVLVAGFYLIGAVGLPGTILTAAIINLVVGLAVIGVVRLTTSEEQLSIREERRHVTRLATGEEISHVARPATAEERSGDVPEAASDAPLFAPSEVVPHPSPIAQSDLTPRPSLSTSLPSLWRVLLAVAAGTALSSFIYEIAWIRMLSLVLGSATHSFELMLSAFIFGLAVGAFWLRTKADRFRDPMRALAVTQWTMGALAIATLALYLASFDWMAFLVQALDRNREGYRVFTLAKYGIALAVMLPATFCAGVTLPLITRMLLVAGSGERAIGAVYSVNTLGSIAGAVLAALVLMPLLGLKVLLITGGAIDMALGVWLMFLRGRESAAARNFAVGLVGASVVVIAAGALNAPFDRGILISGVYRYGRVPARGQEGIEFYRDGRTATVSVRKSSDGSYSLATNGKPDASLDAVWFLPDTGLINVERLDGDESTQVLLPLITLAHVPQARHAAVIGNGSGMTSHLLLGSRALEELVTIEIEPEMINGSRLFRKVNGRIFTDPRSRFVHDDAKSYFASANRRFDLIVSEPSNPWVSGVSGLFTDEFYRRLRTYLTPDGVFGQWLHLYEIDDGLILSVIKAVHRNFASYEVFFTADVDILIVASNEPALPAPDWSVFRLPPVAQDLRRFYAITPEAAEATRLISRAALLPLIGDAEGANSDFYPTLDLLSERTRFAKDYASGWSGLGDDRLDVGALLTGRRILPSNEPLAPLDIARVKARALGAALRTGRPAELVGADDPSYREAATRWQTLHDRMAAGHAPADWPLFVELVADVERDRHAGTMGWADEPFFAEVARFFERRRAPPEAKSALRFMRSVAAYRWAEAAAEVDTLLAEFERDQKWVDPDYFRDGAVAALLKSGKPDRALTVFNRMGQYANRSASDLRVRLLGAAVAAAQPKGNKGE